jgi:hypothetical protein
MELDQALALIKTYVGTRYDERVVQALVEACESGRINAVGGVRSRPRRAAEPAVEPAPEPVAEPAVETGVEPPAGGVPPVVETAVEQPQMA